MSVDLQSIFITSGVNDDGKPFCTIAVHSTDRMVLIGQMSPEELRGMALGWLGAAEAADQDAAVLRVLRDLELPDQLAGMIITNLREYREKNAEE